MADLIDYTNAVKAGLDGKAPVGHTHTAAAVTDLTETVQDIVGALLVAGVNTTITYNDTAGTVTIDSAGGGGGGTDPEIVRDVIGSAIVAGAGVQVTVNDAADTITISSTAVLPTRQVISGTGLTGGGDLSANRTLSVDFTHVAPALGADDNYVTDTEKTRVAGLGAVTATGADQAAARAVIDAAVTGHAHDDRYYTETEADGRFVRTVNGTGPDGGGNVTVTGSGTAFTLPATFPTTLPFDLVVENDGRVVHDYVPAARTGTTLYVSMAGSEANDGLTPRTAVQFMSTAIAKVVAGTGDYTIRILSDFLSRDNSSSPSFTLSGGRCLTIVGDGPSGYSWITAANAALTWTADGTNTWKATRNNVKAVWRAENKDSYGVPIPIRWVSSLATCQATPHSWFADATSVWINTSGAVAPTLATHHVGVSVPLLRATLNGGAELRHKNVRYLSAAAAADAVNSTDGTGRWEAWNSWFTGGASDLAEPLGNAVSTVDLGRAMFFNCLAAYGPRDGFNYHSAGTTLASNPARLMFEYDCISYKNGYQQSNSNASSAHEAVTILRVRGDYTGNNGGPAVSDVNGCWAGMIGSKITEPGPIQTNALLLSDASEGHLWDVTLIGPVPLVTGTKPVTIYGSLRTSHPTAITGTAINWNGAI